MKKFMLVAGILTAGIMSANDRLPVENQIDHDQEIQVNMEESRTSENVHSMQKICVVFHATCTSAYTCFEGNSIEDVYDDAVVWAGNIQANYCMINSPFEP